MKGLKNKIKKKQALMIVAFLFIIFCVFAGASGLTHNITTFITSKVASTFNNQDYLEINRNNTPKINVNVDSSKTFATVAIKNYPTDATSKQYRLDEEEPWKDYTGEFTIKENTIIQTRYKSDSDEDYTEGSSKVVAEINYNINLQEPIVTLKEGYTTIEQTKLATKDITVNLSTEDTANKTIVYEVSVTRYPLNQEGLINDDGTVNVENVKNAGNDSEYDKLETQDDYSKIDESNLKLDKSGVYKIKVRATTHGGFVKSEEVVVVTALDKVERDGLLNFKTEDGANYTLGTWTKQQNVIVTLNTNSDILFGNNNVTYSLSGATTQAETPIQTKDVTTIENHGITILTLKIKIGAITITTDYEIRVCKDHNYNAWNRVSPTCTKAGSNTRDCKQCGYVQKEVLAATGHSWPSSYSRDDSKHYKYCNACGATLVSEYHSWSQTSYTAPTCTSYGTINYKCYTCGATKTEYPAALGHNMVGSGCTQSCSRCGYSTGSGSHLWYWNWNTSSHWQYCYYCGVEKGYHQSHNIKSMCITQGSNLGFTTRCSDCKYCIVHKKRES